MALLDETGRLFGKYNVIDAFAIGMLFLLAGGVVGVQSGWHKTSGQMIQGEAPIEYTVLLQGVRTLNTALFERGKQLSITIRNQPRGKVTLVDIQRTPKKIALASSVPGSKEALVITDPVTTDSYDYRITLKDHAIISPDGYVTSGIKVKIGLPIELEGYNYRLSGTIIDVQEKQASASSKSTGASNKDDSEPKPTPISTQKQPA